MSARLQWHESAARTCLAAKLNDSLLARSFFKKDAALTPLFTYRCDVGAMQGLAA